MRIINGFLFRIWRARRSARETGSRRRDLAGQPPQPLRKAIATAAAAAAAAAAAMPDGPRRVSGLEFRVTLGLRHSS